MLCYKGRMIVKMACSELLRENAADHEQADRRGRDWMLTSRPHDGGRKIQVVGKRVICRQDASRHQKTPYRFMYVTVSIPYTDLE